MSSLKQLLFPAQSRSLPAQRWMRIGLRTLHLIGISGLGGAFLYNVEPALWMPYWWLVVCSGGLLVFIELWVNGIWLLQLAGLAIIVKLSLLFSLHWWPQAGYWIFIIVIIISGIISHSPARLRHYSIWYRRRLDESSHKTP